MPELTGQGEPDVVVQEAVAPTQEVQSDVITAPSAEVDESTITPEVPELTQETSKVEIGQLAAIKAEREAKKAAEVRAQVLERELEQVRRQTYNQPQTPPDPFNGLDEEDLVNVKSVKNYLKTVEERSSNDYNVLKGNISAMIARQSHPDFDDVVKMLPNVATPMQMGIIFARDNPNPAETAYNFVKASPQYLQNLTKETVQKTAQQTIDTINQHTKKVKTLSNSGSGTSKIEKKFSQAEINEIDAAVSMGNTSVLKRFGLA